MNYIVFSTIPVLFSISWSIILFYIGLYKRNRHNVLFSVIMIILSLVYIGHTVFFYKHDSFYWKCEGIYLFAGLLIFPLFFIYVKTVTDRSKLSFLSFIIFLPALMFFLISLILSLLVGSDERAILFQQFFFMKNSLPVKWSNILYAQKIKMNIYPVFLILVSSISIKNIQKLVSNYKRNDQIQSIIVGVKEKFKYLQYLLITQVLLVIIFLLFNKVIYIIHSPLFILLYSIFLGTISFIIGIIGYRQNNILLQVSSNEAACGTIDQRDIVPEFVPEIDPEYRCHQDKVMLIIKGKIIKLLEEDKIFQKKDLSLNDLATILCTNKTYVSMVINTMMHMTFDCLIDNYRVEFAKSLLSSDSNNKLLIDDVMKQSGFASNSSFYRIFKQKTGTTPKKYKYMVMHLNAQIGQHSEEQHIE